MNQLLDKITKEQQKSTKLLEEVYERRMLYMSDTTVTVTVSVTFRVMVSVMVRVTVTLTHAHQPTL